MRSPIFKMLLLCIIFFVFENIILTLTVILYGGFSGSSFRGQWYTLFFEILVDMTLVRAVFILPFYLGGFLFKFQRYHLQELLVRLSLIIVFVNVLVLILNPYIADRGFVQYLAIILLSLLSLYSTLVLAKRFGVIS